MRALVIAFFLVAITGPATADSYADAARAASAMDANAPAKEEARAHGNAPGTSDCGAGFHRTPNGDCLEGTLGNPTISGTPPPRPAPPGGKQPGPARMP